ncbi:MAG: carboxypeptidase-like regulatory domain-containing protein [Marinoscillum sp.]
MFCSLASFGQHTVKGTVVDENEEGVGFSHVYNETIDLGKVSDIQGKFVLTAAKGDTLRFSYVGYKTLKVIVSSSHLVNFMKVTLPRDSMLLPSITIYSDPYYKVPLNIKGEPIFINGVSLVNPPDPIKAGDASFGATGVGGVPVPAISIEGPITYFSRDEREKRKAAEAYEETRETITYQRFIAQDSVRVKLSGMYALDSTQYDEVIRRLHQQFPGIQKTYRPNEIWNWLLHHFDRTAPIVKEFSNY